MKHKTLGRTGRRRLTLPALSGGLDLSAPPHRIADDSLSFGSNLWWHEGALTTRPALVEHERLSGIGDTLEAIPLPHGTLLHSGSGDSHRFTLLTDEGERYTTSHSIGGVTRLFAVAAGRDIASDDGKEALLFTDGGTLYAVDTRAALRLVEPYVPTVLMAARPTESQLRADSGAFTEPFNLLTDRFICRYTSDGVGLYYWLPEGVTVEDAASIVVRHTDVSGDAVTHRLHYRGDDGVWREEVTVDAPPVDRLALYFDPARGCFWFYHALGGGIAPVGEAICSGNIELSATRTATDGARRIGGMRFGVWFGGEGDGARGVRLFVGGNPACRNRIHWSALGDATYFPENNYAYVGDASAAVTAFGKQSDMLVIFKEREVYATRYAAGGSYTAEDLQSGRVTDTEAAAAVFTITQIHSERGCDCPDTLALCGERLVWCSSDGHVYTLHSGGTYDVRSVRSVSKPVEAALARARPDVLRAASAAFYSECYLLLVGSTVYVFDTTMAAWYCWDVALPNARARRLIRLVREPLLLASVGGDCAVMAFDDAQGADTLSGARHPIVCELATKCYESGDTTAYKQVCGVTVWMSGGAGVRVAVTLFDGSETRAVADVTLSGSRPEDTLPRYLLTDAVRLRRLGVRLRAEGRITLDALEVTFRRMGEMRG